MATVVLSALGSFIGSEIGGTILGISAATIGSYAGYAAGSIADSYLFSSTTKLSGPRLADINIQTSMEGAPIPRVDGYMRIAGQLIWATKFKETQNTTSSGGKGIGGSKTQTTTYTYSISFAVGLCEGIVHKIGRIWADGNLLDTSKYTLRFYAGTEDQTADPTIEEVEGTGNTPSYRGLAYLVFEDMDLTAFGNRIPQLQIELIRSITADRTDALENVLAGVNLIPGAGEFVYATDVITSDNSQGTTTPQNKNNADGIADTLSSLNDLEALAPNLQSVQVVVGWFGDDLRASDILIKPGVEYIDGGTGYVKSTYPEEWKVNGIERIDAYLISENDGRPAYGGTPSDASVVQIIQEIKSRGWAVTLYPFLFMDIANGNSLPDPYSNNAATIGQGAYPWRGRVTPSPAPGYTGSVDQTSGAATQIADFFGSAAASDFAVSGTEVSWTGGTDWGFRRMVLHYAKLCVAAGGVDTFIIASELRGLTRARSDATTYPAVAALKTLAADVKAIVGSGCKVSYAADWSEYNNHQTGGGEVLFNLDPLWSDSNIDFIGIDNYMPLADWRDGTSHLDYDATNGPTSPYDRDYLQGNIKGGEDYDWYYASSADRDAQTRTTITDGTYGKPWVFRAKDLWNWWSNLHYDRPGGTQSGSHTAWVAQSKPIRFTELGCPAIDKGANEPNVFVDAKSSESALPYYSTGQRDDLMQRAFLEAHLNYWIVGANNPTSTVYSAPMVDTGNINVWCWDARPFPFFPQRSDLWGDAANYELGHWMNGRLGAVLLADLVAEICDSSDFSDYDVSNLSGLVTGFARTNTMSARDELNPLMAAFFFDGVESQGQIKFLMRGRPTTTALTEDDLVVDPDADQTFNPTFVRAQDDDLPVAARISFIDPGAGYQQGIYEAKRLVGNSNRVQEAQLPLVMDRAQAGGIGDRMIQETWLNRETGLFALPTSFLALDPADEVVITSGGRARRMRISEINDTASRAISTVLTDPSIYEPFTGPARDSHPIVLPADPGRALVVFADLPMLSDDATAWAPYAAAFADPWPNQVLIYRSPTTSGYELDTIITQKASIGETTADFYAGPSSRMDYVNSLYVKLYNGTLASADISTSESVNALAVQNADGEWEILQFANATLTAPGRWTLTNLIRGMRGTEQQMRSPVAAGARVIVLDTTLAQLGLSLSQFSATFNYVWGPKGKDISDPAYQSGTFAFEGIGMKPFAPCQLAATLDGSGDATLTWIRRDRSLDANSWDLTEIEMSEQTESYDVEILDGSTVVRTFEALSSTTASYPQADQIADLGSDILTLGSLKFRVYQNSAKVGRGYGATTTIYF